VGVALGQSIGIDETNPYQLKFLSSRLWVLKWPWQTFFWVNR